MDEDRRRWLEKLADAAGRAMHELRASGDPAHRDLIEDLERLRESVTAELEGASA